MSQEQLILNELNNAKAIATSNPKESLDISKKMLEAAREIGDEVLMGNAYFHMAYACRVMSSYALGLEYAFSGLELFSKHDDMDGLLKIKNIIGIIYFYHGDYASASRNFLECLEILKTVDQPLIQSSALNNLGEIQRIAQQWEKANEYYFESLKIAEEKGLTINAAIVNHNISEIFYKLGDMEKSVTYLERSRVLAQEDNNLVALGEIETKFGRLMYLNEEYDKANEYYLSAYDKFNEISNKFYLVDLYINMASLEEAIGGNGIVYLNEALEEAIKLDLHSKIGDIYKLLSEYYERLHEYKKALKYYKLHYMKEKELEAGNLSTRLEIMSIEFSYKKFQDETKTFKQLNEQFKKEIEKSNEELKLIKKENSVLIDENSRDELTKVYNRRGIHQLLNERTSNMGDKIAVVFIVDIDFFKKYNDYWGHIQGDICLRNVAGSLNNLDYDDYFVGRFGGEEFLCFAKVDGIEEAREIGDSIRKTVSDLKMTYSKSPDSKIVTVSVGGKVSDGEKVDLDALMNLADDELYRAKRAGRNMVFVS